MSHVLKILYESTEKQGTNDKNFKGYSRKKDLGGEDGRRYIFLWMVDAQSIQIIWVIGVRPNLITWVVGVRPNLITWVVGVWLCGRGRNNIICQKKREVLSNLAKKRQINVFYVHTCPTISPVAGHSDIMGPLLSTWGKLYL